MSHRTGHSRQQFGLLATPLDDMIAPDNLVRVVDAFVNALDLAALGFTQVRSPEQGAQPYHPAVLLKIYLYGYFNSIRSSRKLDTECRRNIEMMWLIECQKPSYHTISNFRCKALHRRALKNVFAQLVQFCKQAEVIGGEVVAVDGSKFRAQNSMKNNFNLDKVERQLVSMLGVSGPISRFQSGFFALFVPWRTVAQEVEHPRCNALSVVWCATGAHGIEQSRRA